MNIVMLLFCVLFFPLNFMSFFHTTMALEDIVDGDYFRDGFQVKHALYIVLFLPGVIVGLAFGGALILFDTIVFHITRISQQSSFLNKRFFYPVERKGDATSSKEGR